MTRCIILPLNVTVLLVLVLAVAAPSVGAEKPPIMDKRQICREAKGATAHIDPADLHDRLAAGEDLVVLDIRTRAEYDAGHIAGSIWLPRGFLEFKIERLVADPETEIVVYCLKGCRGSMAARTLREMGYRNVCDLAGGIARWVAQGLPLRNQYGGITVTDYRGRDPYSPVRD